MEWENKSTHLIASNLVNNLRSDPGKYQTLKTMCHSNKRSLTQLLRRLCDDFLLLREDHQREILMSLPYIDVGMQGTAAKVNRKDLDKALGIMKTIFDEVE